MNVVMFTGSRHHYIGSVIARTLYLINPSDIDFVIVGDASGVDQATRDVCDTFGIPVAKFTAHWQRLGRRAGPERNQAMVDAMCELHGKRVYAFPAQDSKGTRHAIAAAKKAGLEVVVMELP